MWQEIAVFIIGLIVIFYIGKKIYKFFTHPTGTDNPCQGCRGCALKNKTETTVSDFSTQKQEIRGSILFCYFIQIK